MADPDADVVAVPPAAEPAGAVVVLEAAAADPCAVVAGPVAAVVVVPGPVAAVVAVETDDATASAATTCTGEGTFPPVGVQIVTDGSRVRSVHRAAAGDFRAETRPISIRQDSIVLPQNRANKPVIRKPFLDVATRRLCGWGVRK